MEGFNLAEAVGLEAIRLGLYKWQLADAIGVSEGTLRRAERGRPVAPGNAIRIADYFGVRPTEIQAPPVLAVAELRCDLDSFERGLGR